MIATWTFPNRIRFGAGSLAELPAELARASVRRPLLVTDPGVRASGLVDRVLERLAAGGFAAVEVFADCHANPIEADVLGGLARYRDGFDGLIGLGGGSPIDCAKAIRILATHPGPLADYDFLQHGADRITPRMPPMIAVPTTAGTGSEVARGALINLDQTGRKTLILSPHLLPTAAVCDPELTRSLPPSLTAGTGMDAAAHCIESYLSPTIHPICDGIAREGLRSIRRGLLRAVDHPDDLAARSEMMTAALLGGISFHKGLGAVHSLAHAIGSAGRAHHGTLNAIFLPVVLRFNRAAAADRMADLARTLGGEGSADELIAWADRMLDRLPLPKRLRDLGIAADHLARFAELAHRDHCHRTNPRSCNVEDLAELLRAVY